MHRLQIIESGRPGWQAVAWILERTMGSRFAPPRRTVGAFHSGTVAARVVIMPLQDQTC